MVGNTAAAVVLVLSLSSVCECEATALLSSKVLGGLYVSDVGHVLIDSVVNLSQYDCGGVGRVAGNISGCVEGSVNYGDDCLVDVCGLNTAHNSGVNQLIRACALKAVGLVVA